MTPNPDKTEKIKKEKLPSELKKEVKLYREKRDLWKARTAIKRKQLQIAMSKITDIEESRDKWKKDAKECKILLENFQKELEKTKDELRTQEVEIANLKKKL